MGSETIESVAPSAARRSTLIALAMAGVIICLLGACRAWSAAWPALGERPYSAERVTAARCVALACWGAAHAILFAIIVPLIYRRRALYVSVAGACGLAATLAAIAGLALFAAAATGG